MRIFVVFILFLITLEAVFGITTTAVFNVGDEKPKIVSVDKLFNEIQIKVMDLNGYEDIEYVKVIFDGKEEFANFKSGSGNEALYVFYLIFNKAKIEVSDGVYIVGFDYGESGMTGITGSVVLEKTEKTNPLTEFFRNFFKKLFSFF